MRGLWLELESAVLVTEFNNVRELALVIFKENCHLVSKNEILGSGCELLNVMDVEVELQSELV